MTAQLRAAYAVLATDQLDLTLGHQVAGIIVLLVKIPSKTGGIARLGILIRRAELNFMDIFSTVVPLPSSNDLKKVLLELADDSFLSSWKEEILRLLCS